MDRSRPPFSTASLGCMTTTAFMRFYGNTDALFVPVSIISLTAAHPRFAQPAPLFALPSMGNHVRCT